MMSYLYIKRCVFRSVEVRHSKSRDPELPVAYDQRCLNLLMDALIAYQKQIYEYLSVRRVMAFKKLESFTVLAFVS